MAVKKVLGYKLRPGSLTDLYRLSDDERLAMLISFLEKMKVEKHKIMNGDWVGTGDTLILFSRKEDGKLHIYVYTLSEYIIAEAEKSKGGEKVE